MSDAERKTRDLIALDLEEFDKALRERDEYISVLEEYIRAMLWLQNYHDNQGKHINARSHEAKYRRRRVQAAANRVPLDLFDEVDAENALLKESLAVQDDIDTDAVWKLLRDRGLAGRPNPKLSSLISVKITPYMQTVLNRYKEEDEEETDTVPR